VIHKDGKSVLVVEHGKCGGVEIPAGRVNEGEAPHTAVARELREEAGLHASAVSHFTTKHRNNYDVMVYLVEVATTPSIPKAGDDAVAAYYAHPALLLQGSHPEDHALVMAAIEGKDPMSEDAGWIDLVTTYVAGTKHHTNAIVVESLRHGMVLALRRDPKNAYDKNAVEIFWPENNGDDPVDKLGFIPAVQSPMVARLMDNGYPVRAVVDLADARKLEVFISVQIPTIDALRDPAKWQDG